MNSTILVITQFTSFAFLALSVNALDVGWISGSITIVGIIIGLVALWEMRKSKIKIFPEVDERAKLIKTGIYKFIRHPMYLALLATSLGFLLMEITFFRVLVFLILIGDLLLKIEHEERLLNKEFKNYKKYQKTSKKLVPYIY